MRIGVEVLESERLFEVEDLGVEAKRTLQIGDPDLGGNARDPHVPKDSRRKMRHPMPGADLRPDAGGQTFGLLLAATGNRSSGPSTDAAPDVTIASIPGDTPSVSLLAATRNRRSGPLRIPPPPPPRRPAPPPQPRGPVAPAPAPPP